MLTLCQIRLPSLLGVVSFVVLLVPVAQVGAAAQTRAADVLAGGPDNPIEIILPFELQASFFHSLPIAGHIVTPDQVAQLVIQNPRLRVTTGMPYSGKGMAIPIHQSEVAGTHADPLAANLTEVRGAGRAPRP